MSLYRNSSISCTIWANCCASTLASIKYAVEVVEAAPPHPVMEFSALDGQSAVFRIGCELCRGHNAHRGAPALAADIGGDASSTFRRCLRPARSVSRTSVEEKSLQRSVFEHRDAAFEPGRLAAARVDVDIRGFFILFPAVEACDLVAAHQIEIASPTKFAGGNAGYLQV